MRLKCTPLVLLFILPLFNSCINNADFDQLDELSAEPIVEIPIVFFDLDQLDFLDDTGTAEIQTVTDVTDLNFFETETFRENLIQVNLEMRARNTFNRTFRIRIQFLDEAGNPTYTFATLAVPFSGDQFITFTEVITIVNNPGVLNTSRARVTITIDPANETLDPEVSFNLWVFFI